MRGPSVPHPWGSALESDVQVPILGALGNIPAIANSKMNQPTQHAHQSSFFHRDDQSIFAITFPPQYRYDGDWMQIRLSFLFLSTPLLS